MVEDEVMALLREQRIALLENPKSCVHIYRFPRALQAATTADNINNGREEEWPSSFFVATFDKSRGSREYDVLVRLRPDVSLELVRVFYDIYLPGWSSGKSSQGPGAQGKEDQESLALFKEEMGADGVGTRAANALYRRKGITSLAALRDLRREMGDMAFGFEIANLRNIGRGSVERIFAKVGESGEE